MSLCLTLSLSVCVCVCVCLALSVCWSACLPPSLSVPLCSTRSVRLSVSLSLSPCYFGEWFTLPKQLSVSVYRGNYGWASFCRVTHHPGTSAAVLQYWSTEPADSLAQANKRLNLANELPKQTHTHTCTRIYTESPSLAR